MLFLFSAGDTLFTEYVRPKLIQFRIERLMIGTLFCVMVAVLAGLVLHGIQIGTWASTGINSHLIPYTIGGVVLFKMIVRRWRYFW